MYLNKEKNRLSTAKAVLFGITNANKL